MRLLLSTLLAVLLWAVPAQAAITVVSGQTVQAHNNDVAVTFSSNWTSGNHVLIALIINNNAETVSIDGVGGSPSIVTLHDEAFATQTLRAYVFCFQATATADNSFTATTSGGSSASVVAVELAGASCIEDGTSDANANTNTVHSNTIAATDGSFCLTIIRSTSVSNFTAATGTSMPVGGADIPGGDGVGVALGSYLTAASGAATAVFTSAASETAVIMSALVAAGGGGGSPAKPAGSLLLRGVGGRQ